MRKTFILVPAALLAMLAAGPVAAIAVIGATGKVPAGAAAYQKTGTISSVDLGSRAIVVNGVSYLFPSGNVVLHNKTKSVTNAQQLKKGMRIGFSSSPGSAGNRATITDVWLLQ